MLLAQGILPRTDDDFDPRAAIATKVEQCGAQPTPDRCGWPLTSLYQKGGLQMIASNPLQVVQSVLPIFVGSFIGFGLFSCLSLLLGIDVPALRRHLGTSRNRLPAVPTEQLDAALLTAAKQMRTPGRLLLRTLLFSIAICVATLINQSVGLRYPGMNLLLRACVGGVVAGLLIGLALVCEGRDLIARLNRLLPKQES